MAYLTCESKGPIGCPETPVSNCQTYAALYIPEERSPQQRCGGSPKSRTYHVCYKRN